MYNNDEWGLITDTIYCGHIVCSALHGELTHIPARHQSQEGEIGYLHDNFSEEASGAQIFTITEVSSDLSEGVGPYKKTQFCPNSQPLPGSGCVCSPLNESASYVLEGV